MGKPVPGDPVTVEDRATGNGWAAAKAPWAVRVTARRFALRPVYPTGWWLDGALVAGVVLVCAALLACAPVRDWDLAIRDLADVHRPPWAEATAIWVNRLGSGGILTTVALAIAIPLSWLRRTGWPLAHVGTAFLATGLVIAPLKLLSQRAAPHSLAPDDVEVRLFSDGLSYPSGHAVNTIVWYAVICALLLPWLTGTARRCLRWIPPVLVGLAGTYLGYHWLTDTIVGIGLGILIARGLARIPWP